MKILLLTAHPVESSFNFALRDRARQVLTDLGHHVELSNLVQDHFRPTLGRQDFLQLGRTEDFELLEAQRRAATLDSFAADIAGEQAKLLHCELLILQFPIWWGSFPAVLKGWIDRVLANGFAYGRGRSLAPRQVLFSVTTGGAADEAEEARYRRRLAAMADDVFGYLGWRIQPTFIAHGVGRAPRAEREDLLDRYQGHLLEVLQT